MLLGLMTPLWTPVLAPAYVYAISALKFYSNERCYMLVLLDPRPFSRLQNICHMPTCQSHVGAESCEGSRFYNVMEVP